MPGSVRNGALFCIFVPTLDDFTANAKALNLLKPENLCVSAS